MVDRRLIHLIQVSGQEYSAQEITDADAPINTVADADFTLGNQIIATGSTAGAPAPINIPVSTLVGRAATGNVAALTAGQVRTILGVEPGATADQTGPEILSLLLPVDGAGSGLDADLLDGQHAVSFSRTTHLHDGVYVPVAQGVPRGGLEGYRLTKASDSDYEMTWSPGGGSGTLIGDPDPTLSANLDIFDPNTNLTWGIVRNDVPILTYNVSTNQILIGSNPVIPSTLTGLAEGDALAYDAGTASFLNVGGGIPGDVLTRDAGAPAGVAWSAAGGGVTDFLNLNDVTPGTFAGAAGAVPSVNSGETALDFYSFAHVGTGANVWDGLSAAAHTARQIRFNRLQSANTAYQTIVETADGIVFTLVPPGLFALLNNLTAEASPNPATDYVAIWNAAAGTSRKVLLADLPGGTGGGDVSGAANVGAGSVNIFKDEIAGILNFRRPRNTDGRIAIAVATDNISFGLNEASVVHGNLSGVVGSTYSHAAIDTHIDDQTLHRTIDDGASGATDLLSALEIDSRIQEAQVAWHDDPTDVEPTTPGTWELGHTYNEDDITSRVIGGKIVYFRVSPAGNGHVADANNRPGDGLDDDLWRSFWDNAQLRIIYVSPYGDDGNTGHTPGTALATIQAGLDKARDEEPRPGAGTAPIVVQVLGPRQGDFSSWVLTSGLTVHKGIFLDATNAQLTSFTAGEPAITYYGDSIIHIGYFAGSYKTVDFFRDRDNKEDYELWTAGSYVVGDRRINNSWEGVQHGARYYRQYQCIQNTSLEPGFDTGWEEDWQENYQHVRRARIFINKFNPVGTVFNSWKNPREETYMSVNMWTTGNNVAIPDLGGHLNLDVEAIYYASADGRLTTNPQKVWTTSGIAGSGQYSVGNRVFWPPDGKIYRCNTNHAPSDANEPPNMLFWDDWGVYEVDKPADPQHQGQNQIEWTGGIQYEVGDRVWWFGDGHIYKANTRHTALAGTNDPNDAGSLWDDLGAHTPGDFISVFCEVGKYGSLTGRFGKARIYSPQQNASVAVNCRLVEVTDPTAVVRLSLDGGEMHPDFMELAGSPEVWSASEPYNDGTHAWAPGDAYNDRPLVAIVRTGTNANEANQYRYFRCIQHHTNQAPPASGDNAFWEEVTYDLLWVTNCSEVSLTGGGVHGDVNVMGGGRVYLEDHGLRTLERTGGRVTLEGGLWIQPGTVTLPKYARDGSVPISTQTFIQQVSAIAAGLSGPGPGDGGNPNIRNAGPQIPAGAVLYPTGFDTGTGNVLVAPADANDAGKMPAICVAKETIDTNEDGEGVVRGVLPFDTTGMTVGDILYVSETAGELTTTEPTSESQEIARVIEVGNPGQILIDIKPWKKTDASQIKTGTLADARIAETNVKQHEAALDHDALTNFAATKHVDHAGVSFTGGLNSGIVGGGTLEANKTFQLDISELVLDSGLQATHEVAYDNGVNNRKITAQDFFVAAEAFQDGDHLDVDFTPANYTPDATPTEAADVDDLAAHLKGIDTKLGTAVTTYLGQTDTPGTFTENRVVRNTASALEHVTIVGTNPVNVVHTAGQITVDSVIDRLTLESVPALTDQIAIDRAAAMKKATLSTINGLFQHDLLKGLTSEYVHVREKATAPTGALNNQLWFNTTQGILYSYNSSLTAWLSVQVFTYEGGSTSSNGIRWLGTTDAEGSGQGFFLPLGGKIRVVNARWVQNVTTAVTGDAILREGDASTLLGTLISLSNNTSFTVDQAINTTYDLGSGARSIWVKWENVTGGSATQDIQISFNFRYQI